MLLHPLFFSYVFLRYSLKLEMREWTRCTTKLGMMYCFENIRDMVI